MPTSTFVPRPLFLEDLYVTTLPAPTTIPAQVLGSGTVNLSPIPITLLTQLLVATSDMNAASGGVAVGGVYILNTSGVYTLRTRMA